MEAKKHVPGGRKGRGRSPSGRASVRSSVARSQLGARPDRARLLHVEIVCVGRELLRGRAAEAISPFIAANLSHRGAIVHRIATVDDTGRAIAAAVREALDRGARLVITTGGLGPADDDRTREGVADALRLPLAASHPAREMVESAYRRLRQGGFLQNVGLTAAREKMFMIPVGGEPLSNDVGIAPGILVRLPGGACVLCLPGVPEEARWVFQAGLDRLRDVLPKGSLAQREIETHTADESSLVPTLDRLAQEFPAVWIQSHAPGFGRRDARVRVTLEACSGTKEEAESIVEGALRRLLALAGGG